jgi:2-polyprenyl-6-methoxyphenol hydroxylase-like FAD-dependent oxidoreductase
MQHAVVIGGSMAGLLAARVLSDHCERVTLIERDNLPEFAEHRRGVPQGRHTHGLLASGREVLEQYFPGIAQELIAAGAVPGDILQSLRWFMEGGCHVRALSGLEGLMMSRPFLEARVRQRVLARTNVTCLDVTTVDRLEIQPGSGRVTGVRIGHRSLTADLTVDATGRGSKTLQWLRDLGFDPPLEERVEIGLAYTTRLFRRSRMDLNGDLGAIIPPTPEGKRGGVILAQEGDRWTVTLIAHFIPPAPEELGGFIEYARSLPAPYIHEVVRNAEPIGDGFSARFPASVRRRFERLTRFPEGFLVFGDAMSSFNPIYGQGMSVACLEAVVLEEVLRKGSTGIARQFFARAAKVVDIPWSIAVGNDLRMREAVGPRTAAVRLINWYLTKLHKAAHSNPVPAIAFHKVGNLLAPPPTVMHPRIALQVLSSSIARQTRKPEERRRAVAVGR